MKQRTKNYTIINRTPGLTFLLIFIFLWEPALTATFLTLSPCTYSIRAPNTKSIQANIQASMAVSPSAFGVFVVTVLKMLTRTRKSVTSSAILPGITSMGMRKEIQETITNKPRKNMISSQGKQNAVPPQCPPPPPNIVLHYPQKCGDIVPAPPPGPGVVRVQCSGVVRGHCGGTAFCLPRLLRNIFIGFQYFIPTNENNTPQCSNV